jgi:hypothetical protein
MDHFDRRDTSVVNEIGQVDDSCRFSYDDAPLFLDTEGTIDGTLVALNQAAAAARQQEQHQQQMHLGTATASSEQGKNPWCAVVAPPLLRSVVDLMPVIDAMDTRLLTYHTCPPPVHLRRLPVV